MILQKNEVGKNKDREREREFAKCIVRPQKRKFNSIVTYYVETIFSFMVFLNMYVLCKCSVFLIHTYRVLILHNYFALIINIISVEIIIQGVP